jgi:hypothetical protein
MQKQELEALAKISLTEEAWQIAERAYVEGDQYQSKQDFVKGEKWLLTELYTLSKAQRRIYLAMYEGNRKWAQKYFETACNAYQVDYIDNIEKYAEIVKNLYAHLGEVRTYDIGNVREFTDFYAI